MVFPPVTKIVFLNESLHWKQSSGNAKAENVGVTVGAGPKAVALGRVGGELRVRVGFGIERVGICAGIRVL